MTKQTVVVLLLVLFLFGILWTMSRQAPAPKQVVSRPPPSTPATPSQEPLQPAPVSAAEKPPPTPSRNPFRLPDGLVKILQEEIRRMQEELRRQQQAPQVPLLTPDAPAVRPEELFKLQGVFWGTPRPQALINRKILSVGDEIEGAKVISIKKEGVTLMLNGMEVVLKPSVPGRPKNKEIPTYR